MCTASWLHDDGGYQLFFNRDEKRTRQPAEPPRVEARNGMLTIAPVDGDHGGTWISVNERGLALCLLNGASGARGLRSRGLLLNELAGGRTTDEVLQQLRKSELTRYSAFIMALLEAGRPTTIAKWDGASLATAQDAGRLALLASSSFNAAGVCAKRREEFARITGGAAPDPMRLFRFHESHGTRADAYSPCMHRADAETVSFSWVNVTPHDVTFFYTPAAPCRWVPGQTVSLPRVS